MFHLWHHLAGRSSQNHHFEKPQAADSQNHYFQKPQTLLPAFMLTLALAIMDNTKIGKVFWILVLNSH